MEKIFAKSVLLDDGWHEDVTITHEGGRITHINDHTGVTGAHKKYDVIVPGMPNLHSHAFQRAMAGFAERRGKSTDSFWSWRTEMYRLALTMTPDDVETVASLLYMEMLEAGFTRVGEFHYLHHDQNGGFYDDIGEMAGRIAQAAQKTGINLTLLPVFYAHSGFGGGMPSDGQKRFINSVDSFDNLLQSAAKHISGLDNANMGIAPHSLRAVTMDELHKIIPLAQSGPIHIHIAEQIKEVEDCIAHTGKRPVEWLLENIAIDNQWCFIHATHMTDVETVAMAKSGAVAGLCPITEANLGDGIFNALTFIEHDGAYGIGSDSNVLISVSQELRQFEYSIRLKERIRNAIAGPETSNGRVLFDRAIRGGAQALQADTAITVGKSADFVALSLKHQDWIRDDTILDSWIFADNLAIDSVWVNGREVVKEGNHIARPQLEQQFNKTMNGLFSK